MPEVKDNQNRYLVTPEVIKITGVDTGQISDGYHTFNDLYAHRRALFIALCHCLLGSGVHVWKSHRHSDGTGYDGWFIAGIGWQPGEQITYHLPNNDWPALHIPELEIAPPFDGHTADDVLQRLQKLKDPGAIRDLPPYEE